MTEYIIHDWDFRFRFRKSRKFEQLKVFRSLKLIYCRNKQNILMKLTEWVAKGLYLTLIVICVLDGLLNLRYLKITGGIHDIAPADHVLRQTFNSTCLILLGTGVPPCSTIMSSQKQKSQRT